ncbi:MAG: hypothetical protein FWD28_00530 [Treponema sp.]|nr:hypothetical protein [Treponema sp.]
MGDKSHNDNFNPQSDESFLKFWGEELERQQAISDQVIETEENMNRQAIENQRQIEESEKKFLLLFEEIVSFIRGIKK